MHLRPVWPLPAVIVAAVLALASLGAAMEFKAKYWAIRSAADPSQPWEGSGPGGGWGGLTGLGFLVFAACLVTVCCGLVATFRRR
jgi:hypothetical protein